MRLTTFAWIVLEYQEGKLQLHLSKTHSCMSTQSIYLYILQPNFRPCLPLKCIHSHFTYKAQLASPGEKEAPSDPCKAELLGRRLPLWSKLVSLAQRSNIWISSEKLFLLGLGTCIPERKGVQMLVFSISYKLAPEVSFSKDSNLAAYKLLWKLFPRKKDLKIWYCNYDVGLYLC